LILKNPRLNCYAPPPEMDQINCLTIPILKKKSYFKKANLSQSFVLSRMYLFSITGQNTTLIWVFRYSCMLMNGQYRKYNLNGCANLIIWAKKFSAHTSISLPIQSNIFYRCNYVCLFLLTSNIFTHSLSRSIPNNHCTIIPPIILAIIVLLYLIISLILLFYKIYLNLINFFETFV
jgi:hypothetical protein